MAISMQHVVPQARAVSFRSSAAGRTRAMAARSVAPTASLKVSSLPKVQLRAMAPRPLPLGLGVRLPGMQRKVQTSRCEAAAEGAPAPKKVSAPRLPLDSIRFFLISYIATGHFIACATKDPTILAFFSQINVVVGAFFVLSGYVQAYVATSAGKREADPKRTGDKAKFIIGRIMGYYPLYFLTQLIFLPMFVYADSFYNGFVKTAWHALITFTLSQAWFPAHAELWNAPTWFLSAFTFAMVVVPYALEPIAKMTKKSLKICMASLTGIMLVAKTGFSYDLNMWTAMDGLMSASKHPNIMFGNLTRFHPFYALVEILIGVVACRLVMMDGVEGDKENEKSPMSPLLPAIAMIGIIVARTFNYLTLNDHLTRAILFIPLFTLFLMNVHRETIYKPGTGFSQLLAFEPLAYLGTISFPFYILHGPIGQLFYKKVIAMKVFGQVFTSYPMFFFAYMAITLAAAALVQQFLMPRDSWFSKLSASASGKLVSAFSSESK